MDNAYIAQAKRTESLDLFKVERPRLLHAALGITTELSELLIALWNEDTINIKEEFGDVLWYMAIAADDLGVQDLRQLASISLKSREDIDNDPGSIIAEILAELNDVVKRACFYGLELNELKFAEWLATLAVLMEVAAEEVDLTLDECAEANIAKLARRYPEKFTTDAAVNRDIDAEMAAVTGT